MPYEARVLETGTREKNQRERREKLIAAALDLFRERGFAGTTMEDIAERAGLSRRTAFRYFARKDDLAFPYHEERLGTLRRELAPRPGESPWGTVKRACLALARDYTAHREQMLLQWEILQSEPVLLMRELRLVREFEVALQLALGGSRRGRVRAAAIVGAVHATLREWLEGGARADLARLGRETFAELERGFLDENGRSG